MVTGIGYEEFQISPAYAKHRSNRIQAREIIRYSESEKEKIKIYYRDQGETYTKKLLKFQISNYTFP